MTRKKEDSHQTLDTFDFWIQLMRKCIEEGYCYHVTTRRDVLDITEAVVQSCMLSGKPMPVCKQYCDDGILEIVVTVKKR